MWDLRLYADYQLDHYIIYHCHFELGKLYAARGNYVEAKKNFDIVMSGMSPLSHDPLSSTSFPFSYPLFLISLLLPPILLDVHIPHFRH
jgi:hypothetical protein